MENAGSFLIKQGNVTQWPRAHDISSSFNTTAASQGHDVKGAGLEPKSLANYDSLALRFCALYTLLF